MDRRVAGRRVPGRPQRPRRGDRRASHRVRRRLLGDLDGGRAAAGAVAGGAPPERERPRSRRGCGRRGGHLPGDGGAQAGAGSFGAAVSTPLRTEHDAGLPRHDQGVTLRCNLAAAHLLGLEAPGDVVGRPVSDFLPDPTSWEGEVRELEDAGTVRDVEEPWETADGRNLWVLRSGTLVEDPDSGERVILRTAQDITERRALKDRLARSERLEAMGQLAGGVAHDFNNLLTAVMGYAQLLHHELEGRENTSEVAIEAIGEVMKAADTAAALTRQLLTFSRSHLDAGELIEVGGAIRNVAPLLRRIVTDEIEFVTELDPTETWVEIDPSKLEQVALNLVINARDAIEDGGTIRLVTDTVEVAAADTTSEVKPGRYVRLRVLDTGQGVPEELREKIFEPFFSTKADGTGMGLATVFGIVRGAGGSVRLESAPEGGTVFEVLLPVAGPEGREEEGRTPANDRKSNARTILVVDDNEAVRAFAESVLRRAGYRVRTAASGAEGIAVALEIADDLELIISDVVMSGMSGPEMVRRILTEEDGIRVLYVSGYTDEALAHHEVKRRGSFLQKPFTPDSLLTAVRELLVESRREG
ncbi:MAG: response regulator [Longimicrobiales bacterium]|nr:response regulator [Longimicrobiales bacterium]